jgi:hypothetical protein
MLVSNRSIIIDPVTDNIRFLDDVPEMDHSPWIYPHTPTAFVVPITPNSEFRVMICGGSKNPKPGRPVFGGSDVDASNMCISINPDADHPEWRIEEPMPNPRVMPDSVLLPGIF